jgi:hypothetical protein
MRYILIITLALFAMTTQAGNFFPPEYKTFPYKEGDLLASERNGKFSINKILKIDRIDVRSGSAIVIQGQQFVAPEDDYLLIVSMSFGEAKFDSLEAARSAAESGKWQVLMGHIPNRAPGAVQGQILVGHQAVSDAELEGYKLWKSAFDKGEAGVF